MSFLKRAIRDGISKGVSDAVGKAVKEAVEPKAGEWANKTAQQINRMSQKQSNQAKQSFSEMKGAFANLQKAMEGYATEVGKNIKICPACGALSPADKKFCTDCGAELSEDTVAQSALCPACGKQNAVGRKYCEDCGTKLPIAVAEEKAAQERMKACLNTWDSILPMFPKWSFGGSEMEFEEYDPDEYGGYFASVRIYFGRNESGEYPLLQYWELLKDEGFRTAGRYPDEGHLYNEIGGVCYMVSCEHAFDGGTDVLNLEFARREPEGGFNYVKPEPKPQLSFKDLKKDRKGQIGSKDLDDLKDDLKDLKNLFRR